MEGGNVCILLCRYCDFQCYDHKSLLKHIRATHETDPNFKKMVFFKKAPPS